MEEVEKVEEERLGRSPDYGAPDSVFRRLSFRLSPLHPLDSVPRAAFSIFLFLPPRLVVPRSARRPRSLRCPPPTGGRGGRVVGLPLRLIDFLRPEGVSADSPPESIRDPRLFRSRRPPGGGPSSSMQFPRRCARSERAPHTAKSQSCLFSLDIFFSTFPVGRLCPGLERLR